MKFVYRFLGVLLLIFTLVMLVWGLLLAMGWVELEGAVMFVEIMFGWFGVYFFYITRPQTENVTILQRIVHIVALPLGVLGYLTFKGNLNPADFWPTLNMAMLALAAYGVVVLTKQSLLSNYIKWFMSVYVLVMLVLSLLHMQGYFENGKLLSLLVFSGFGIQVAMITLSRKPVEEPTNDSQ